MITLSDSSGYIVDPGGIDESKLAFVMELKNIKRGRISEYVVKYPSAKFVANKTPWEVKCDVALPCATQNELHGKDEKTGYIDYVKGANIAGFVKVADAMLAQGVV